MRIADLLVPTYRNHLAMLGAWLAKATAHSKHGGGDALLAARLADDMFPLATQVRFACAQAIEGMHRLRGRPFPDLVGELLAEGRGAGDAAGTMADAQSRITQTLAMIDELADSDGNDDGDRPIEHALPMGIVFDLTLEQYARDWALPQFHFHLMTAYAILRAEGVPLGKGDFVTPMWGYARAGTLPPGMG